MDTRNKKEEVYEKCVICGKKLNVLKTQDVSIRDFFEIGVGQLCEICYGEVRDRNYE